MNKIELSIPQLEHLLNQQKLLTVERCLQNSSYYNKESTEGEFRSLPIDKDKFTIEGMKARYPEDFVVLKKYLKSYE